MILIKNANLISMEEINYEICDILIEGKTIAKIGKLDEKDYPNAKVIDAKGKYVTPGLVDPHCHVGLMESTIGWAGSDVNEATNPDTPELRGIDGIKPHDECFKEALESGVTTVCLGPGSANLIGGTFAAIKTKGNTVDEIISQFKVIFFQRMILDITAIKDYNDSNSNSLVIKFKKLPLAFLVEILVFKGLAISLRIKNF